MRTRLLLLATTTGYQVRAFGEAAERLGVELAFATDRCHLLDDPWHDRAVPIRFHDEEGSLAAIERAAESRPVTGVLAVGDRPAVVAALAAARLGLPGHPPEAARAASNKRLTRERLAAAGLHVPWFLAVALASDPSQIAARVMYPCVVKPLALAGSRGVIRADEPAGFIAAFERLQSLLRQRDVRTLRDPANDEVVIEEFIEGAEFALEGVLERGRLKTLAIFDKPDPLDGPFFEETTYVTPSSHSAEVTDSIIEAVEAAIEALGLWHGPIHAECRVNARGVFVLEVAARPIGGLCARALRFDGPGGKGVPLEELLLRHALGERVAPYTRERAASGVMMIPIPRRGFYKHVEGVDEARAVAGIDDICVTATPDQLLLPLPEGASYLGFIFARREQPGDVVTALGAAHARLRFVILTPLPVEEG